ncbi:MAG: DUF2938 domain-containing protein [Hyphomonadaceae bacterium]|nr:DUF2938 domain-containing protein [Hyphomonadaceae bacterium]
MEELLGLGAKVGVVGIGATLILDFWSLFLKAAFGVPSPNYKMVGRWIGYFTRGRFVHRAVADAPRIGGEHLIGWSAHYGIGILYAGLLVAFAGADWLNTPTVLPAMLVGIMTVAAPFLMMQPAMGAGFASSKAERPNIARMRSLAAHAAFGFGLYLAAVIVRSVT